ncbi:MAG: hypothetical protein IJS90_01215 [Clostridia bacterium]|nr:hypothetical protein [Clostridia bacterium]
MMKKTLIFILSLTLFISAAGCSVSIKEGSEASPQDDSETIDSYCVIADKNGKQLGKIDSRAVGTAADEGVFYSIYYLKENEHTAKASYGFFYSDSGESVVFGSLANQGYEAVYSRTELDGVVYTLALSGDPFDTVPDSLHLLAFNVSERKMADCVVSENGYPFSSMAVKDGRLLIMVHEMTEPKFDKVYEFDPASGAVEEVLSITVSNGETDSLRSIAPAKDGFYVLRLHIDADGSREMFLDSYASDHRKTSETSLNDIMLPAISAIHGISGAGDAQNETGMHVSGFRVEDGRYMYYENFGLTRLILDLEEGEALFVQDDLYSMTPGGGDPVFYRMQFPDEETQPTELTCVKDGQLFHPEFSPADPSLLLQSISRSPNGAWLSSMTDPTGKEKTLCYWTED